MSATVGETKRRGCQSLEEKEDVQQQVLPPEEPRPVRSTPGPPHRQHPPRRDVMQGHYGIALAVTGIPGGLHAEARQVQDGQPEMSETQPHVYVLHVEERNVSRCRHQFPGNRQRTSVSGARTIVGILVVRYEA